MLPVLPPDTAQDSWVTSSQLRCSVHGRNVLLFRASDEPFGHAHDTTKAFSILKLSKNNWIRYWYSIYAAETSRGCLLFLKRPLLYFSISQCLFFSAGVGIPLHFYWYINIFGKCHFPKVFGMFVKGNKEKSLLCSYPSMLSVWVYCFASPWPSLALDSARLKRA